MRWAQRSGPHHLVGDLCRRALLMSRPFHRHGMRAILQVVEMSAEDEVSGATRSAQGRVGPARDRGWVSRGFHEQGMYAKLDVTGMWAVTSIERNGRRR